MPNLVLGFQEQAAPPGTLQPFATTTPATPVPPVQVAQEVEKLVNSGPSDALLGIQRCVDLRVDFSDIAALATAEFGPVFPDNTYVNRFWYEVLTTFTSATDAATIGIGFLTDDVDGLLAAVAISTGTPFDAGFRDGIQTGAIAAFSNKLTAARQLSFTRGGAEVLTAGAMILHIEYVQSV